MNTRSSSSRLHFPAILATAAIIGLPTAHAALFVNLPNLTLQPNQSGQVRDTEFDTAVFNDSVPFAVSGIKLTLQVEDGGPDGGGTEVGPAISFVDVLDGTIFESKNEGHSGSGQLAPQIYEQETLTPSGTVNIPSGTSKLGTVTFDTTGIGPGTYDYTFNIPNGAIKYFTEGADEFPTFTGGTLTVVPEPATTALIGGLCCLGFGLLYRRQNRGTSSTPTK